jgi:3-phosphoshikimate 1-carboxyvinyltransferase
MIYSISAPNKNIKGDITLTASKSESNRVLLIQALCKTPFIIHNLAAAKDTQTLISLLKDSKNGSCNTLDVGPAGTTMRFLTAYLSITEGEWILTGSERMKQRPIHILVNALKQLGANIEYMEQEGFPPLKIKGKQLTNNNVTIDGSVSSQYITALLLIAPTLPNGLKLQLEGAVASKPYIDMTLKIMQYFGVKYEWTANSISVKKQDYIAKDYTVEGDWSAASYYYSIAALAETAHIQINGLLKNSLQGDSVIADIMKNLGVNTTFENNKIIITKDKASKPVGEFNYDFSNCPDLAQTLVVITSALNVKINISGLHSLKIKETNRILALQNELSKTNITVKEEPENTIQISGKETLKPLKEAITTYEDHRMAMAFAPLALKLNSIKIEHPEVVEKSYPDYWKDLQSLGFSISE